MLSRLLRSAMSRLGGGGNRQELVERVRDRAFESFHENVLSGRLKSADALTVWERLEQCELRRRQLVSGRWSREGGQELLVGYTYLVDYVGALTRSLIQAEPSRSRTLHPQRFQSLYNGVSRGQISCEDLKQGACARRLDPDHALHSKLWGGVA